MPKISYGRHLFTLVSTLKLTGDSNIIQAGDSIERKILLWARSLDNQMARCPDVQMSGWLDVRMARRTVGKKSL